MGERLREYAVLGVSRGGRYAVRHKGTGEMFSWRAMDAGQRSREQLQTIQDEIRAVAELEEDGLLRYRDTILHAPTSTLYIVLEHTTWMTLEEIASDCLNNSKYFRESYIWYLLHEMARVCKLVYDFDFKILQKVISASSIYIDYGGEIKIDCFDLAPDKEQKWDIMHQLGRVLNDLCYLRDVENVKVKEFCYSDDLKDIVNFLTDESNSGMKPDIILYHPTVLANLENTMGSKRLSDVLVSTDFVEDISDSSKCDSEKAMEVCKTNEFNTSLVLSTSPMYANASPKRILSMSDQDVSSAKTSLSPTLAALALELPGFVPRRTVASNAIARYNEPQKISERTLSSQWITRLMALREREETLNRRERDLISKEIVNSPNVKIASLHDDDEPDMLNNAGITLPPVIAQTAGIAEDTSFPNDDKPNQWVSRRNHRRSSSVRTRQRRRQSYSYEDMDSSLSADAGDGSVIVTATKFSKDNMPRRSIFPDVATKKVHFTSANPFVESDDSVTLTFYELENLDSEGYQVPRNREYTTRTMADEISKFKYLDLEKAALEKRAAMEHWSHSSPSKQAKFTVPTNPEKKVFSDITNRPGYSMKKTPSKSSINSKASNTSNGTKYSMASVKSNLSSDSDKSKTSYQSCASTGSRVSTRLRNAEKLFAPISKPATRQSMLPIFARDEEIKKPKGRKSLLPFKTPFKFLSSKT